MNKVKFAVFTDLHYDHIHDGDERIEQFVTSVKDQQIDFIIQLGDFAYPIPENQKLIDKLKTLGVPFYGMLGNHDTDQYTREKVLCFLGLENSYYAFRKGNIKFIVLDTCFVKTREGFKIYQRDTFDKRLDKNHYPYVPEPVLRWLEDELDDDAQYYVLFSHHSMTNDFANRGVINRDEIQACIAAANQKDKKVLLYMSGHDHGEDITQIGDTVYYALNSMSYIWVGPEYEQFSYDVQIHQKYPYLKDLILYRDGLFAIVTVDEQGDFTIEGLQSDYQRKSPQDLNLGETWNGRSIKPNVTTFSKQRRRPI